MPPHIHSRPVCSLECRHWHNLVDIAHCERENRATIYRERLVRINRLNIMGWIYSNVRRNGRYLEAQSFYTVCRHLFNRVYAPFSVPLKHRTFVVNDRDKYRFGTCVATCNTLLSWPTWKRLRSANYMYVYQKLPTKI